MPMYIRPAQPDDRFALANMLTANHLKADDLPDGLSNFWLASDNDRLIGSVGVELHDSIGLLRSVCVIPSYRSQGIARQLIDTATEAVKQLGIYQLYLLTTTADAYFLRLGFARIDRTNTPKAIQQTTQFSGFCPASAVVMRKHSL